jgi:hypothetical protein
VAFSALVPAITPPATATYVLLSSVGIASGVAPLDATAKVPAANLPAGSGGGVNSVTAGDGTVVIGGTSTNPTVRVGTGVPQSSIVTLPSDLAARALAARLITAGTGLSGGGDLTADRSLAVVYGTTAVTAAAGNDTRLSVRPYAPVALTDAATIATDASLGTHFRVTIAGNRTLANPTNGLDGQKVIWSIVQDAVGGRTLVLGSAFNLGVLTMTLSTAANKVDYMGAVYRASSGTWDILALTAGY